MGTRTRLRNGDELIETLNRALDEVEDLRTAIEYDEEYRGEASIIIEPVAKGLARLLDALNNGDLQAVLSLFEDDAIVVSPLYGKMGVEQFFRSLCDQKSPTQIGEFFLFEVGHI